MRSGQRSVEARRELSPGARDGWVGDREQVGDLDGGEGRVGGGHDGADGHERVVEHGDVDARGREHEGDVARGEADAGAERGSECAGPGQERRERDGRAGAGVDERRAG